MALNFEEINELLKILSDYIQEKKWDVPCTMTFFSMSLIEGAEACEVSEEIFEFNCDRMKKAYRDQLKERSCKN